MRLAKQIPPEDKKTTRGMSLRGYLFGFIALCFILGSGIIIIQWSTIKTGFHNQIAEAGFKLETVEINGRNHTTHQELNDALKLQNGEPILSINLAVTVLTEFANAFFKVLIWPYLLPEFLGHHASTLPCFRGSIQNKASGKISQGESRN